MEIRLHISEPRANGIRLSITARLVLCIASTQRW